MAAQSKKFIYAALAILIVWFALEAMASLVLKHWQTGSTEGDKQNGRLIKQKMPYDPKLLWTLSANQAQIQQQNTDKNPTDRILFLGDSSVYGFGIDPKENFVEKTGSCLNRPTQNGGVPGYSSTQTRIQLSQILEKSPPKIAVIASLWSDMMQSSWTDRELYQQFGDRTLADTLDSEIIRSKSAVYRLIRAFSLKAKREKIENPKVFWNAIQNGDPSVDNPRVPLGDYERNWEAMHAMAAKHRVKTVLLLLPTNTTEPQPDQAPLYRDRALSLAKKHHATQIDMDRHFERYSPKEIKDRFLDVVHPNEIGHHEIAMAVCNALNDAE